MTDEKIVASGLLDALEAADIEFRYLMPEIFAKVDALKADPDWKPADYARGATRRAPRVSECRWCGDDFIDKTNRSRPARACCSQSCHQSWRGFLRRRKKAA